MSNASWTPNEAPNVIFAEKTWLQGAILTGVGYGIVFTLYCMTARALLVGLKRSDYKKIGWLVYITAMFFLGSIFMGACAQMTQLSFVDYRNIPGGPSEYENVEFSIPADEAGNVVFVLTNWLADGLMVRDPTDSDCCRILKGLGSQVWRCVLIYRSCSIPVWATGILPCLMYLAEIGTPRLHRSAHNLSLSDILVLGILWLIQISTPAGSPYLAGGNINWTLPYLSTAVALNVVVTMMIATRLLLYRRRVVSVLGGKHGRHYISVAAMMIESAALYSAFALLFIIPFAINNNIANTFLQAISEVQVSGNHGAFPVNDG